MQDAPEETGYLILSRYPNEGIKIATPLGDILVYVHTVKAQRVKIRVEAEKHKFVITRIGDRHPSRIQISGKPPKKVETLVAKENVRASQVPPHWTSHLRKKILDSVPPVVALPPDGFKVEHIFIDEASDIPNLDEIAKKLKEKAGPIESMMSRTDLDYAAPKNVRAFCHDCRIEFTTSSDTDICSCPKCRRSVSI